MIDVVINNYHFRTICERDIIPFTELMTEWYGLEKMATPMDELIDQRFQDHLTDKNTIYLMVFLKPEEQLVAVGSFQEVNLNPYYLGCIVAKPFRGMGLGTEIVRNLITIAHEHFPGKPLEAHIRKDNFASQRVTEKCGGVQVRIQDAPELEFYLDFLDRHKGESDFDFVSLQKAIREARDNILVYQV